MFRYVALVWDTCSRIQGEAARLLGSRLTSLSPQWRQAFDCSGLRVFCADARPGCMECRLLADNAGVVLGALFERHSDVEDDLPSRPAVPGTRAAAAIGRSQGRWLIDHCWGNYVAFVPDAQAASVSVVKDPTGELPCFFTVFRGVTLCFSCIADCVRLDLVRFTLDSTWLRARVAGGGGTMQRCALEEVAQVHRGECIEIRPAARAPIISRRLYWSPTHFSGAGDLIEDSDRAARAVRATVRACTHTWARRHERLLHRLSGGLDSSIILGCLASAPSRPGITSYTYYNPRGRSDERPWARLAAGRAGCPLRECPVTPADIALTAALGMQPSAEPTSMMSHLQRIMLEQPLAAEQQATAVFSGDGGDSGFCGELLAHVVPEFLRRHGLRVQALRLASQVAFGSGLSTWQVLSRALHRRADAASERRERPRVMCRLVNPELLESFEGQEAHPWFSSGCEDSTVMRRMGALPCTPDFYSACDPETPLPQIIPPLYSQPAIELFLRIPLYTHFEGGRDRGLARRAFAGDVPERILRRQWKDRAPGFYDDLVARNRPFLREVLVDGILVRERLLDRHAVEAALSETFSRSGVFAGEIIRHLDVETWARHWTGAGRRRAAA